MVTVIIIVIAIVVYFLPSLLAFRNNNAHPLIIFLINLFAGFTVAGWLVAFGLAIFGKTRK